MSCRKFSAPRRGNLAFVPKRRASQLRQPIRAFERDDPSAPVHLTAFYAYKAGMTHVIRNKTMHDKKATVKEVFEAVTILETPPMVIFGVQGYVHTSTGLKISKSILSNHINESVLRRFYKKYNASKKRMFTKSSGYTSKDVEMLKECDVIRVLTHTQIEKIRKLKTKKAHIAEIQVNGGTISDKVEWVISMLEKEVKISDVFSEEELIDTIGVTKGKGFNGCPKRYGTKILPRKTNKGKRKVGCIGAWHPANVLRTVPRAGQLGFHRRTEYNKQIYKIGHGKEVLKTEFDLTEKSINPMGGFPSYGFINNDFIMVKGGIVGPKKRVLAIRKNLTGKKNKEKIQIKFIDTSSKMGAGRFQTSEEKSAYFGINKKQVTEKTK